MRTGAAEETEVAGQADPAVAEAVVARMGHGRGADPAAGRTAAEVAVTSRFAVHS